MFNSRDVQQYNTGPQKEKNQSGDQSQFYTAAVVVFFPSPKGMFRWFSSYLELTWTFRSFTPHQWLAAVRKVVQGASTSAQVFLNQKKNIKTETVLPGLTCVRLCRLHIRTFLKSSHTDMFFMFLLCAWLCFFLCLWHILGFFLHISYFFDPIPVQQHENEYRAVTCTSQTCLCLLICWFVQCYHPLQTSSEFWQLKASTNEYLITFSVGEGGVGGSSGHKKSQGSFLCQGQIPIERRGHQRTGGCHTVDPNRCTLALKGQCEIIEKHLNTVWCLKTLKSLSGVRGVIKS